MTKTIKTDFIYELFGELTPQQIFDRMLSDGETAIDAALRNAETRGALGRLLNELYDADLLSIDAVARITGTPRDELLPNED